MLAPESHSGFYKTTITKCLLAFCVLFSLVLHMPFARQRDWFTYNLDDIFERGSLWRLVLCKLAFLNTRDLISGGFLLYYFRIFERRFGPRKFLSYVMYCATTTTIFELLASFVLRLMHFEYHVLPSGPYGLIFPFFVPYFLEIPWMPIAHVFGIPITGKSFPYLFGLQLATASPETALLCICGLVVGLLYEKDLLHVQSRWRFPERVVQFGSQFIGPVIETPPPEHMKKPLAATLELQRLTQLEHREFQLLEARRIAFRNFSGNINARS